jgi:hypothetical protein
MLPSQYMVPSAASSPIATHDNKPTDFRYWTFNLDPVYSSVQARIIQNNMVKLDAIAENFSIQAGRNGKEGRDEENNLKKYIHE